jgi:hypothetical protein
MPSKIKQALISIENSLIERPYYTILWAYPVWYYLANRKRKHLYDTFPPVLGEVERAIVRDLKENGIAVTHLDALFPGENVLEALRGVVAELKKNMSPSAKKSFLSELLPRNPVLTLHDPLVQFSLSDKILNAVNAYVGVYAHFYLYTLNITLPVGGDREAIFSQRWHRDPEDKKFCKVFVYLTDVDETSGPFTYVKKSNYGNQWRYLFPQKPPHGIYPPTGEVEKVIPQSDMISCTGKAGTVIFCDTSGLHRGGYATEKERIMFTAGYITDASQWKKLYTIGDISGATLRQLTAITR